MPLDYASIMQAGQNLVPDLQEQMFKSEQNRLLSDQRRTQAAVGQFGLQQKQAEFSRRQQFQADVAAAIESKDPRAITSLMVKYPEFANELKVGQEAVSEQGKMLNLTTMGTIYTRLQSGDKLGAAKALKARIAADKAAGIDTADDEELLAGIESDDPAQQQVALGTVGMMIAAVNPDKWAETHRALNPTEAKSGFEKEYEYRVRTFGKAQADQWAAAQEVTVGPQGGVVVNKMDFVNGGGAPAPVATPAPATQPKGGDPVRLDGGGIEARAKQIVPGVVVTSRQRSPAHNKAVHGKKDSYHLTGQARDFTPPAGMSMAQLHGRLKSAFPGYDVLNEGNHVHIEPGPGMGRGGKPQVAESKTINGKRYFRIGEKWFDNPRGE